MPGPQGASPSVEEERRQQWLSYLEDLHNHVDGLFGVQGLDRVRQGWSYAKGWSSCKTLVFDETRDGAFGCTGQLWIANADAVLTPRFLQDIQATGDRNHT